MNLIFNDDFMQNAIKRINELQEETIQESKKIKGIEPYVKKRLELFDKDEKIREELKAIKYQEKLISNHIFSSLSE
jgi:prophage maintenance system killer protein